MSGAGRETEIKLPFPSAHEARRRLGELGAEVTHERAFEDNVAYDLPSGELEATGRLLRLRRYGARAWLTYKAPADPGARHKVRIEHETAVQDAEAAARLLEGLGYRRVYRYQKRRTVLRLGAVEASVDETPLGCFVELEGEPEAIDDLASQLGFRRDQYVLATYRDLHERAAAARGTSPGDLLLEPEEPPLGR